MSSHILRPSYEVVIRGMSRRTLLQPQVKNIASTHRKSLIGRVCSKDEQQTQGAHHERMWCCWEAHSLCCSWIHFQETFGVYQRNERGPRCHEENGTPNVSKNGRVWEAGESKKGENEHNKRQQELIEGLGSSECSPHGVVKPVSVKRK